MTEIEKLLRENDVDEQVVQQFTTAGFKRVCVVDDDSIEELKTEHKWNRGTYLEVKQIFKQAEEMKSKEEKEAAAKKSELEKEAADSKAKAKALQEASLPLEKVPHGSLITSEDVKKLVTAVSYSSSASVPHKEFLAVSSSAMQWAQPDYNDLTASDAAKLVFQCGLDRGLHGPNVPGSEFFSPTIACTISLKNERVTLRKAQVIVDCKATVSTKQEMHRYLCNASNALTFDIGIPYLAKTAAELTRPNTDQQISTTETCLAEVYYCLNYGILDLREHIQLHPTVAEEIVTALAKPDSLDAVKDLQRIVAKYGMFVVTKAVLGVRYEMAFKGALSDATTVSATTNELKAAMQATLITVPVTATPSIWSVTASADPARGPKSLFELMTGRVKGARMAGITQQNLSELSKCMNDISNYDVNEVLEVCSIFDLMPKEDCEKVEALFDWYEQHFAAPRIIGGSGTFNDPIGIAIDKDHNYVVCDYDNHRIQVVKPDGTLVRCIGCEGSGDGQFKRPTGIAIDKDHNYVISDFYNNRIQVVRPDGTCVRCIGVQGSDKGQFNYPNCIAIDKEHNYVVCDCYNHRIQVVRPDGTFVRCIGVQGSGKGQFKYPGGIAIDKDQNYVVCDCNNHRIQVVRPDGTFVRCIHASGNLQFQYPGGIAIDKDHNYVVCDRCNHRLQVVKPDGTCVRCIGALGSDNGQFKCPTGIAIDKDHNYVVCDSRNHRLQVVK